MTGIRRCVQNMIKKGTVLLLTAVTVAALLPSTAMETRAASTKVTNQTTIDFRNYLWNQTVEDGRRLYYSGAADKDVIPLKTRMESLQAFNNSPTLNDIPNPGYHTISDENIYVGTDYQNDTRKIGVTSAPDYFDLYMIEFSSNRDCVDHFDCEFSIIYRSGIYLYYTKLNDLEDSAQDFMKHDKYLRKGQREALSIALPNNVSEIVGFYVQANGSGADNDAWGLSDLSIYRVYGGKVGEIKKDSAGQPYRDYSGFLAGTVSDYDIGNDYLGKDDIKQGWLYLLQGSDKSVTYDRGTEYYLQLTAGATDFSGKSLDATVKYVDGTGNICSKTVSLNPANWKKWHPVAGLLPLYAKELVSVGAPVPEDILYIRSINSSVSSRDDIYMGSEDPTCAGQNFATYSWENSNTSQLNYIAIFAFGNYVRAGQFYNDYLKPYTATELPLHIIGPVQNVESVTVRSADGSGSLELTSMCVIQSGTVDNASHMNGGFSTQRVWNVNGQIRASASGSVTVPSGGSLVYEPDALDAKKKLNRENERTIKSLDQNKQEGVSIRLADVSGAGIEKLAAGCRGGEIGSAYDAFSDGLESRLKGSNWFFQIYFLEKMWKYEKMITGQTAMQIFNLMGGYWQEPLTLKVTYKDVLGSKRVVEIPFMTAYLLQLFSDNHSADKLGTPYFDEWIAGVFQQGQEMSLRLPLSQYQELVSVELEYGKCPDGIGTVCWGRGSDSDHMMKVDVSDDTISVRSISFFENVTPSNFKNDYSTSEHVASVKNSSATPVYYYLSENYRGKLMNGSGKLTASVGAELKEGAAPGKDGDYQGKYLVVLNTMKGSHQEADKDLKYRLNYTDTDGNEQETDLISIKSVSKDYYGFTAYDSPNDPPESDESWQYLYHVTEGNLCFFADLEDVKTVDSIYLSLSGKDDIQIQSVQVVELSGLGSRTAKRTAAHLENKTMPALGWSWDRKWQGIVMSRANTAVLLQKNDPAETIYFSIRQENGEYTDPRKEEKPGEYLEGNPQSMTYKETLKDLGLAVPKKTYQVDVKVADVEDAGSSNYFYFQLLFEHGSSGLVLANQQLASDSFRQGVTEGFTIKTTQNYGAVRGVRIICDTTSSGSQAFDKLNIESISVKLNSIGGVGKNWIVERVGWVDINYRDEGETQVVSSDAKERTFTNEELTREYPVTRTTSTVNLEFCLTSATDSAYNYPALGGNFDALLSYRDSSGIYQEMEFNLLDKIHEYNNTEENSRVLIRGKSSRFLLSMNDISSVISLKISRREGTDSVWKTASCSVDLVGEMGRVYISSVSGEYVRDAETRTTLTTSTNQKSVKNGENVVFGFGENTIEVKTDTDDGTGWSMKIGNYPDSNNETLNIYVYAGTLLGKTYEFTEDSPALLATVRYNTLYGGNPVQNAFTLDQIGKIQGTTVLYGTGLKVSSMSSVVDLTLSKSTDPGIQPVIKAARMERVRDGVIVDTLYFDFGDRDLSLNATNTTPSPKNYLSNMQQIACLQPAEDTNAVLTPETSDIGVALRYTSELDPKEKKTVYESPYVLLTDADIYALKGGRQIQVPFHVDGIGEVVGIKVVSSGYNISFENAILYNYSEMEDGSQGNFLGSCQIAEEFKTYTIATKLLKKKDTNVTPVTFYFKTAGEDIMPGAGTSGSVQMNITYTDLDGETKVKTLKNVANYLADGQSLTAGSEVSFGLLMSNVSRITQIELIPGSDDWYLSELRAQVQSIDGNTITVLNGAASVNAWATVEKSLVVPLNVQGSATDPGSDVNTGEITGLTLIAENTTSGDKVTKKVGETLTISAIPGDKVTLTAEAAGAEGADLTLKWAPNGYMSISEDKKTATIILSADMDVSGEPLTTMVSCVSDPDYQIPVKINVTKERPEKPKITGLNLTGAVYKQSGEKREESDATSGKTLELNVFPKERIHLTPSVSGVGGIDTSVALNKNTLNMAVIDSLEESASGTDIKIKEGAAAGTVISTEIYCTADTSYRVPVRITVLADTPYVDLLVAKKNGETVDEGLKEITYTGTGIDNTCKIEVDMGSETEVTLYIAVSANKWSPNTTISETTSNSRFYPTSSSGSKLTGYVKLTKTGENASDVNLTFQGKDGNKITSFNVTIMKKAGN